MSTSGEFGLAGVSEVVLIYRLYIYIYSALDNLFDALVLIVQLHVMIRV